MKEISSMDFPQHGEVFYFYGKTLTLSTIVLANVIEHCLNVTKYILSIVSENFVVSVSQE
jgi:hypothetical protein